MNLGYFVGPKAEDPINIRNVLTGMKGTDDFPLKTHSGDKMGLSSVTKVIKAHKRQEFSQINYVLPELKA